MLDASTAYVLRTLVPKGRVLVDQENLTRFGGDWTKQYPRCPSVIVLPKTVGEVQAVVQWANNTSTPLVPSGGRTGLSGGAAATQGEVVIALDLMNEIINFDRVDSMVQCQAGVITASLQAYAEERNCCYPVDFASSGSSQIGGNIATNAGGIKVIRYGMTRDWLMGIKVVTGAGELLECNHGLIKNATGYDFRHLFVGSEGTLGIVVEATLKLAAVPAGSSVIVLGLADLASIMPVLETFRGKVNLSAFEFFSERALSIVTSHQSLSRPFETATPFYALIEFDNNEGEQEAIAMEAFEQTVEEGWVVDGVMSQNISQAASLWRLREGISESLAPFTPYKNDLSVRVSQVPQFLLEVDTVVQNHYPDLESVWFGHIGDGNLHLNILKPNAYSTDEFVARCAEVSPLIFQVVQRYQGAISAEHGVGLLKQPYLSFSRSETDISLMRQVKKVFDPNGIMNPGKIFS